LGKQKTVPTQFVRELDLNRLDLLARFCCHRLMRISPWVSLILMLLSADLTHAGSATWSSNPTSGDWNTAANWMPNTVPNGTSDVATFGTSNVTDVTNADVIIMLDSLIFSPGAPQYTINALDNIELYGAGIVNNSGAMQSLVAGVFIFNNSATAGDMVSFTTDGGDFFLMMRRPPGRAHLTLRAGIFRPIRSSLTPAQPEMRPLMLALLPISTS
jgi:hypothetical protein